VWSITHVGNFSQAAHEVIDARFLTSRDDRVLTRHLSNGTKLRRTKIWYGIVADAFVSCSQCEQQEDLHRRMHSLTAVLDSDHEITPLISKAQSVLATSRLFTAPAHGRDAHSAR
jgi:hypothetical protein